MPLSFPRYNTENSGMRSIFQTSMLTAGFRQTLCYIASRGHLSHAIRLLVGRTQSKTKRSHTNAL